MPDETNATPAQPDEASVEVSEQELADLGDFLAQVQIVLIGHEQRIGVLEAATFGDSNAGLPDEGDTGSSDGSVEDAGENDTPGASDSETPDDGELSDR